MRIADEAEDLAQLWGTQAGFVVNQVRRDRNGWDHLFEMSLPRKTRSGDPLGLATCALTCRIQVKAVTDVRRSVPIKLTNWKRAVEDPLPWFFLLIRSEGSTREATLIHMDKALVERVVARLCKLPASAKAQLHRKTMALNWEGGTRLESPVERSLSQAITAAVGSDAFEYAKAKQQWYEHAGYTNKSEIQIAMTFGPLETDELYRRLARAAIGLDALESSQVSLSQERFGRDEPLRTPKPITAKMSWGDSTAREMMLNVLDSDGLHLATLPVSVRSSTSVFPLPRKFWLLRFQSQLIDMVMDVGAKSCRTSLNPLGDDQRIPLKALYDNLTFLKCLDDHEDQEVEFVLSRDEYSASLARGTGPASLSRRQYLLAIDTIALWSLLGHLNASDANICLTPKEVSETGYAARAMLMARTGTDPQFFVDLGIETGEVDFSKPIAIVTNPRIRIGAITYMDLVAFIATPTPLPEHDGQARMRVTPERCQLLSSRRYVANSIKKFDFEKAALSFETELEGNGYEYVIGMDWACFTGLSD